MGRQDRQRRAAKLRKSSAAREVSHAKNKRTALGIALLLVMIVWIVFGQTLGHEFINYDDDEYIAENVHVRNGLNWADAKWAFTTGYAGYAHPVTWLTHQLDCQLYGPWAGGHHLTNVVLHSINAVLLFLFFWRTTNRVWPGAFIAGLFAIHPLHVESVAWVAERKDVLSGLFFLLTLHAYAFYAAKPKASRYFLTLFLFTVGILSKPTLVTVPLVLLLLDYWPLRRVAFSASERKRIGSKIGWVLAEKIPFALIAVAWSITTFSIQGSYGGIAGAKLVAGLRVGNAIMSYATYLWETVLPQNLALFYPYPRTLPFAAVLVSAAALAVVSILCLARARRSPYLIVGWLWYLGMLVPMIGFIQAGEAARADRYTYLPQIGLCLAITFGALELSAQWRHRREILAGLGLLAVIAGTIASFVQTSHWRNNETLWNRSLSVTSGNYLAENNLGNYLLHKERVDEAVDHFHKALEILPSYAEANNNLGYVLANKGNWAEAISFYEAALHARPDYVRAHANLGVALAVLGRTDAALTHFQDALRIDDNDADVHANLANLMLQLGRRDDAVSHLKATLHLRPGDAEAQQQLRELGVQP